MPPKQIPLTVANDGNVIEELKQQIASEEDPATLVKIVLCWEGIANSAYHCSHSALQKLRATGWTIVKYSQQPEDQEKRKLLERLLRYEYPYADSQSITKYTINFARYLQMSDAEFAKVERIQITHVGNRKATDIPVSSIGFTPLDASQVLCGLLSSETEQPDDPADGSSEVCDDQSSSNKYDRSNGFDDDASGDKLTVTVDQSSLRNRRITRALDRIRRDEGFLNPIRKCTKRTCASGRTPNSAVLKKTAANSERVNAISLFDCLGHFLCARCKTHWIRYALESPAVTPKWTKARTNKKII